MLSSVKSLIPYLPKEDVTLAFKFLNVGDYTSLSELIDSAIILIKKSRRDNSNKYKDIDLNSIRKLKSVLDSYILMIEINSGDYD